MVMTCLNLPMMRNVFREQGVLNVQHPLFPPDQMGPLLPSFHKPYSLAPKVHDPLSTFCAKLGSLITVLGHPFLFAQPAQCYPSPCHNLWTLCQNDLIGDKEYANFIYNLGTFLQTIPIVLPSIVILRHVLTAGSCTKQNMSAVIGTHGPSGKKIFSGTDGLYIF